MSSPNNSQGLVSAQWSLDTTANSAIAISTGILKAATSDNVQPLALSAVEAFGATLAMCETTRRKVEQAGKTHHVSYTIKFLKSTIGYAKGDCGDQLSSSDSGTRFLGLAAALLCTSSIYFASRAAHAMLEDTAPDWVKQQRLIPTIGQLQDILKALDYKLCSTGFANSIIGWQTLLENHPDSGGIWCSDDHPPVEVLQALIKAFRSLDRLGDGDHIEIRLYNCIPWVVAFTSWCLGISPNIRTSQGHFVSEQPGSKVTVWGNNKADVAEEIKIIHGISNPSILWSNPFYLFNDRQAWGGMISVKEYGSQRVRNLGLDTGLANRALFQALTHSVGRVQDRIFSMPASIDNAEVQPYHPATADAGCSIYRCSLFPVRRQLEEVFRTFMNVTSGEINTQSQEAISDLAVVASYETTVADECNCVPCLTKSSASYEVAMPQSEWQELSRLNASQCLIKGFRTAISALTAEILALSLFDCTEPVKVFWPGSAAAWTRASKQPLKSTIDKLLWSDQDSTAFAFCSPGGVFQLATQLIGHDASQDIGNGTWIASYGRGQVVYPRVFDLGQVYNEGALSLGGGPGCIFFDGSKYDKVIGTTPAPTIGAQRLLSESGNDMVVKEARNLFQNDSLEWKIELGENHLKLAFGPSTAAKIENPYKILTTMTRSLFVSCSHDDATPLDAPDKHASFSHTHVWDDLTKPGGFDTVESAEEAARRYQDKDLAVIPVAGNEGLRLYSMTSSIPGVVRYSACLKCCLNVCRKTGLPYLVL